MNTHGDVYKNDAQQLFACLVNSLMGKKQATTLSGLILYLTERKLRNYIE